MNISEIAEPILIAHRGLKKYFPENTISAFDAAIEKNAVMIELDVSLSKDRKVVVIHDDTLDRTTDGKGNVCDYTLEHLKSLDAGSWFSGGFKDEKIPTLREIFERYADKTTINIEVKPEAYEKICQTDSIEQQIFQLIQEFNCLETVIISSFEIRVLKRFGRMDKKPLLAYLTEGPIDDSVISTIRENGFYSWNPDYQSLTQSQFDLAKEHGLKIFTYTVNDKKAADNLFRIGVNGIFTDDITLF